MEVTIIEDQDVSLVKKRKPRQKKAEKEPKKPKVKAPEKDLKTIFEERLAEIDLETLKKPWMAEKAFRLVDTIEELEAWVNTILTDQSRHRLVPLTGETKPVIAVDTETDGLDIRIINGSVGIHLAGICLSADGVEGLYIPVGHLTDRNIDKALLAPLIQRLFDASHLVFFNAKFDREVLRVCLGIVFKDYPDFEDVQVLSYLHDPKAKVDAGAGGFQSGGLKATSEALLNIKQIELDELVKVRAKVFNEELGKSTYKMVMAPFTWVPTSYALWYAAGDAITTWLLWETLHRMRDFAAMRGVHRLDHELVDTIAWVERQRIRVDTEKLEQTIQFHEARVRELAVELGQLARVEDFNPGSTPQLQQVLFGYMPAGYGMTPVEFSEKTGDASTAIGVLKELQKQYPDNEFLTKLMDFREYAALHPGNLKYEKQDRTARFYFKQNVVAGGRLAAAGGDYLKDGGCGLNPQAIKKVGGNWWVKGRPLRPEETQNLEEFTPKDLDPSCFNKDGKIAPNIIRNHIGRYFGKDYCLVPSCSQHQGKTQKVDANEVINLRALFTADPGWTMFSIDFCVAPHTRILTADLQWKPASDIREGEELIGFDEDLPDKRWGRRCLRSSNVEKVKRLVKPCVRIETTQGILECSIDHSWLIRVSAGGRKHSRGQFGWREAQALKPGDEIAWLCSPWEEEQSKEAGYLSGVFDGEGWVSKETVGFGQNPGPVLEKVHSLLIERGFPVSKDAPPTGAHRLRINGGRDQTLRFLGSIRPERLIRNAREKLWEGLTYQSRYTVPVKVLSVTPIGDQEVVAIQTSTHTFIAEGCLSHNCNIEMRVAGNISKEPVFINEFLTGSGDFHTLTAKALFPEFSDPSTPKSRTKELRSLAKIINFALLYGGTSFTIYENLNKAGFQFTKEEAEALVERYWESVPVFAQWCASKRNTARAKLLCFTPTGRVISFESAMRGMGITQPIETEECSHRKNFFEFKRLRREAFDAEHYGDLATARSYNEQAEALWFDKNSGVRNYQNYNKFLGKAERVAINIPLQGTAGDLMRSALNRIRKWVRSNHGVEKVFRLHETVHDEIDFSVKNEFVPYILPRINRLMKLRPLHAKRNWEIPIETDCEYGQAWDVQHHLTGDNEHTAAGWVEIPGLESYIPLQFTQECVEQAVQVAEQGDIDRVKRWLRRCHERTHGLTDKLAWRDGKSEDLARSITIILQLHEFWMVDHDEEDSLTLVEWMEQNDLGLPSDSLIGGLDSYLDSIPLVVFEEAPEETCETECVSEPPKEVEPIEPTEESMFLESPPLKKKILPELIELYPSTQRELHKAMGIGAGNYTIDCIYKGAQMQIVNSQLDHIPQKYLV